MRVRVSVGWLRCVCIATVLAYMQECTKSHDLAENIRYCAKHNLNIVWMAIWHEM